VAAKGLGSAKVEQVGAGPTRAVETTQVGELDRPISSSDGRSFVSMSLGDSGETKKVGKYEVVGVLGRGGMGVVYEVVDQASGLVYALKTIETRFLSLPDSHAAQRFKQEISVLERLDHPSVVRLYDSGFARHPLGYDLAFFVMERLEGDTLDRDIKAGKKFSVEETLDTMAQLIDALDYLGSHGVLHRDIKPGNLFREAGGRVVLMDFGLARSAELTRLTLAGQIVGTYGYMSPERLTGRAFDISADIYALGVVLYQMLAGFHPFSAASPAETLEAIKRGLQFPDSFATLHHAEAIIRLIRRMLAYKPEDRPTPVTVHEELTKLLGEPAMAMAKRGRITRKRAGEDEKTAAAPPGQPSNAKTVAHAPKLSPQVLVVRSPSAEREPTHPESLDIVETTPAAPGLGPRIATTPGAPAATIGAQPISMLPLTDSPGFLSSSGPTWGAAGLLTIAATCAAFLAGLLVGRSQMETPIPVPTRAAVVSEPSKEVWIVDRSSERPPSAAPQPSAPVPDQGAAAPAAKEPEPLAKAMSNVEPKTTPPSHFADANAAFVYGELLINEGKYRPAIDVLNRALELNPAYADAHRKLGDAHAGVGETDRAAKHYKSYLALRPAAPDATEVRRLLKDMGM
jgi:serine/threonine protein kinase